MNHIRCFRLPFVVAALVILTVPCNSKAGFEWIGWWNVDSKTVGNGSTTFRSSGIELPNGVMRVEGTIEAQLSYSQMGNPYDMHPPYDVTASSSLLLSRHFRLSGSPGGWKVDLDWHITDSSRFWAHVSTSGPYSTFDISTSNEFPTQIPRYMTARTIYLPDGDYVFDMGMMASLGYDRPPWGYSGPFSVYYGSFRFGFSGGLLVTAVPEPASWLMIGQGLIAAAGITFVSKRRKPGSGRPGSEETSGILDGFETSVIEGVRS